MISDIFSAGSGCERMSFLQQLMVANWESATGPIRLRRDLLRKEVESAELLINARHFMSALARNSDGVAATASGNLNRKFVAEMLDRFRLPAKEREIIRAVCKVVNELDLPQLHMVRLITQAAGCVGRRKGRFRITRRGRDILGDDQTGRLYHLLFVRYFHGTNWHLYPGDYEPLLRMSAAIVLWRLSVIAQNWIPVLGLAEQVIPPSFLEEMRAERPRTTDSEDWLIVHYFINPLLAFDLIERLNPGKKFVTDDLIRLRPLCHNFISFVHLDDAVLPQD